MAGICHSFAILILAAPCVSMLLYEKLRLSDKAIFLFNDTQWR